ncbi:hypothetical protein CPB84DRAFT_1959563, partial [Gymnopilus junonius]
MPPLVYDRIHDIIPLEIITLDPSGAASFPLLDPSDRPFAKTSPQRHSALRPWPS